MSGLTRRQLCAGTALAGAVWGLGGCDPQPVGGEGELTLERLRPLVGTRFMVQDAGGGWRALVLASIVERALPLHRPAPRGESFTLLFDGQMPGLAEQGTQLVEHGTLGAFPLFLVQRGTPSAPRGYAATFTRL